MQIIKKGNLDKLKEPIQFECHRCGCIFVADNTEYNKRFDQRGGDWAEIHCPTCKMLVQQDI